MIPPLRKSPVSAILVIAPPEARKIPVFPDNREALNAMSPGWLIEQDWKSTNVSPPGAASPGATKRWITPLDATNKPFLVKLKNATVPASFTAGAVGYMTSPLVAWAPSGTSCVVEPPEYRNSPEELGTDASPRKTIWPALLTAGVEASRNLPPPGADSPRAARSEVCPSALSNSASSPMKAICL